MDKDGEAGGQGLGARGTGTESQRDRDRGREMRGKNRRKERGKRQILQTEVNGDSELVREVNNMTVGESQIT